MTTTDNQLRSAGHDPKAFRVLYEGHAEVLHAFVVHRAADPDAAFDLTAETFAQAWMLRHRFEDSHDGLCGPACSG